jgi:hypothetical protein
MRNISFSMTTEAQERSFWARVTPSGSDECWEWQGRRDEDGYGRLSVRVPGAPISSHRASWAIHFGPIPPGLFVLHTCDNPPCCNPKHLWLGTNADNMRDSFAKGRKTSPKRTTLTADQVREIRLIARPGRDGAHGGNIGSVAAQFGVGPQCIRYIVRRRTWREVA